MSTYAIGDVHGCRKTLRRLLKRCDFSEGRDRLWFVGDLVNRGPASLDTLRFVRDLGDRATVVLGNHELHLLAVASSLRPLRGKDTFGKILKASDRDDLMEWLRCLPLTHREDGCLLIHAGLLPDWKQKDAERAAREAEAALRGDRFERALTGLYEPSPDHWVPDAKKRVRVGVTLRALTRLRVVSEEGGMERSFTGPPEERPRGTLPWFDHPARKKDKATVIFGHWAALGYRRGRRWLCLDSGCVWGGSLTAVRLDDGQVFRQRRVEPM